MNPTEIRDKLMNGEISVDQAKSLWTESRQEKAHLVPMKQMASREDLAAYSPRLSGQLQQIDAEHFYTRMLVEEKVRHGTALIIYGLIGAIDGFLDAGFYGLSEITEDVTFGVTRVIYRAGDGMRRGKL